MLLDQKLLKDLDAGLPEDEPPATLWHYTTVSAVTKILKGRSVRLGCHAFMNDPAEGTIAGEVVSESWQTAIDRCDTHTPLDLKYIRDTADVLSYFDYGRPELPPTFLFSLTELRDSLSQWSRYGDDGAGIALGFSVRTDELPPETTQPWRTATNLIRVTYDGKDTHDPPTIRPHLVDLLGKYLPQFRDPTEVENNLIMVVHRLSPLIKRAAYAEEREWRIVTRTVLESDSAYEIESNRFGIAPHVPLTLDSGLSLVELMLGPKLSTDNTWSAKWMCRKFGHNPHISRSELAYR